MSPETRYRIEELEKLTGLSRRLIYDYISRDLVPPALGSGKGAYYLEEHYDRLRLISLLRTMGFRLERIEEALESWSQEEISRIVEFAEGRDVESLDALNEWLSRPVVEEPREGFETALMSMASPRRYRSDEALERMRTIAEERLATGELAEDRMTGLQELLQAMPEEAAEAEAAAAAAEAEAAESSPASRPAAPVEYAAAKRKAPDLSRFRKMLSHSLSPDASDAPQTWHRVPINRDVEISYRADGSHDTLRRVRELIARARELFKE